MHRSRRSARPLAAPRVLALGVLTAVVAWLGAVALLAGTLHFALISHDICADHGELVHRASASGGEHPHDRGPVAAPSSDGEEHDHCPLAGRRHDQLAVAEAAAVRVAEGPVALVPAVTKRGPVAPSRAALLLAAPKQSPPA